MAQFTNKQMVPFTYTTQVVMTANQVAVAGVIQMASDSVFELVRFLAISTADNPTDFAPNNFSVQMTDQSTGRLLSNNFVPQAMYVTRSYQFGNDEKYPIQFPAQAIIALSFNNLINAGLTVTFGFKGYKLFQLAPGQ